MWQYIIRRVLISIPTLLVITVVVFSMIHLVPGDPVNVLLRRSPGHLTAGDPDILRHELGLDKPLYKQYLDFLSNIFHGDLGTSIFIQRPVVQIIASQLPYTLRLAGLAMLIIVVLGPSLGVLAAYYVNTWIDTVVMFVAILGVSVPNFWFAIMLIWIVCVKLGLLPLFGPESLKILLLPAVALSIGSIGVLARLTRSEVLRVLGEDYILVARSKGVAEKSVLFKHALRNALIPVVTILGLSFAGMLMGAVIIEDVFGRQGMGNIMLRAVMLRDYPLTQGLVLIAGGGFVVVNLAVDVLYSIIDPRVRYT